MRKDREMTDVSDIDLDSYDPMDREVQQCPYPHYAALREHGPIFLHKQTGMYFASRLDVVNEILRDTELFSSRMSNAGTVGESDVMKQVGDIMREGWPRVETMLTIDPPDHTRYRKLVSRAFSARRIAALEDKVREIAAELIEEFPDEGSIDFHADFAVSFPVRVIRYALNMAPETEDKIKGWSDDAVAALGVALTDERRLEAARGQIECQQYWFSEYEDRLANPQDDILSDLVHADFDATDTPEGETRKLAFPEIFSIIQQLMVAGNETTTKFLNETIRLLIEHPEWWDRLVEDPQGNINGLVEEGLRLSSPNQGLFRVVTRDTEIEGVPIPKGSRIWVMFGAANRDERTFPESEEFDPGRDNLKEHIAFGKGHHFCIGAPLSRLEGKVAFEELTKRIERPAFTASNTFEYEPSFILRGLAQLELDVKKK
jgi:cytochrome P450